MHIRIHGKTADSFSLYTKTPDGVLEFFGYPPTDHGISRDGDSIEMSIDNDTGQIKGWFPVYS